MLSPSENAALDQVTLQHDERSENKPRLLVEDCNPDRTVSALRDIVAKVGGLYDRGVPVRLAFDQMQRGIVAQVMSPDAFVLMAHAVCRPYLIKTKKDGTHEEVDARLPRSLAVMYLDWRGKWDLPVLNCRNVRIGETLLASKEAGQEVSRWIDGVRKPSVASGSSITQKRTET